MIYTVGQIESYETGFLLEKVEGIPFLKIGWSPEYAGGMVFQTVEHARNYLISLKKILTYDIYGVEANWLNTIPQPYKSFNRLREPAHIIRLPE